MITRLLLALAAAFVIIIAAQLLVEVLERALHI